MGNNMPQAIYDSIGGNYSRNRTADFRILSAVKELLYLPSGSVLADIGAGTGSYSNALAKHGYKVFAIEPSGVMRKQAVPDNNVRWLSCPAESLDLKMNSVNGVIVILALHHFSDVQKAIMEIKRICPDGPLVLFTMDPRESEHFWFNEYFPGIARHVEKVFPPLANVIGLICGNTNWSANIRVFPLPGDLKDMNMCSGWNSPEIYLDEGMRNNTSGFALANQKEVHKNLVYLKKDLASGEWDRKYGTLRKRDSFDAGFRFIKFTGKL
jgi:ubiquinone/menaquinone biosynthesis C-methylase UbiE